MRESAIAKRYGKAIFDLALESGDAKRLLADVQRIGECANDVPHFIKGLSDERVDLKRRLAAAGDAADALGVGKMAKNLLKLLIERGRLNILELVSEDFAARVERHERLAVARAHVADGGLAAEVKGRIEEILSDVLKLASRCDVSVDASLLGGIEVWLGDMRYDASIRGKLERMKESLT
ncbi:MAG: ATP synthase F1 subunit delta [Pseudomonadota bacterium]